jgi:large subunit ribosomal protein L24
MSISNNKKMSVQQKKAQKMKVKKGDMVKILSGKDKGKTGKIIEVRPINRTVVVEGINTHKRFEKAAQGKAGTQISFPGALAVSKVMVISPETGNPSRIGSRFLENGNKQRVYKVSGKAKK